MYHTMRWEQDRKQYQVPGAVDLGQVQRAAESGLSFAGWELAQVEVGLKQARWGLGLGQYQAPLSVAWVPVRWGSDCCIPPKRIKRR